MAPLIRVEVDRHANGSFVATSEQVPMLFCVGETFEEVANRLPQILKMLLGDGVWVKRLRG
jgi:hypothetical protein